MEGRVSPELLLDNGHSRAAHTPLVTETLGRLPQTIAAIAGGTAANATGHSWRRPALSAPTCHSPMDSGDGRGVDVGKPEHHTTDDQQQRQDPGCAKVPELTTTVAASTDPYTADK